MRISDLIASCFRSLLRRKLRTVLTIIGVVIGTCAIIVTISLGEGMNKSQMDMISQWTDLTTIQVYRNWYSESGAELPQLDDAAVASFGVIDHVSAVSPTMNLWNVVTLTAGKYEYVNDLRAVNLSILEDMGYELKDGTYPSGDTKNTIYFGEQCAYNFRDSVHPDRWIQYEYDEQGNIISDPPFDPATVSLKYKLNVEGDSDGYVYYYDDRPQLSEEEQAAIDAKKDSVNAKKLQYGGTLKGDYAKDNGNTYYSIYIDIELAKEMQKAYNKLNDIKPVDDFGKPLDPNYFTYDEVIVKVDDMKNVAEVEEQIKDMGFQTNSFEAQRKPLEEQTRRIQFLFGGLGAISMLVAAIGIANTMVMSIYERTREIGVMKVLGCELSNIRWMFLIEAAMIGLVGGLAGLGFSFGISAIINAVSAAGAGGGDSFSSIIPVWLILLGLGFSTLVGIISGFSPANRAVKISALSAIRQE